MKKPNIQFKSLLQGIKDIEERNAYFNYLSDEGKRLEIAWDCLQLVCNGVIGAANGAYWSLGLKQIKEIYSDKSPREFQSCLINTSNISNCNVCARGGIMLSQIRLGNKLSANTSNLTEGASNILEGFSYNSMIKMERQYENTEYNSLYPERTVENLMNILCNVLVNGDFDIEDNTDYLI